MPKLTGAHLFVRCLKLEGIEKVFTIVGDTILPLVDAAEDEGIQFIDARHEGAALHMADGYARITGKPAVGMFTGGPGFSNAISALPAIYTSESPVIFIAGAAPMPEHGMTAFQEIDPIGTTAPVTKRSGTRLLHGTVPRALKRSGKGDRGTKRFQNLIDSVIKTPEQEQAGKESASEKAGGYMQVRSADPSNKEQRPF